jgi:hypothetical protein
MEMYIAVFGAVAVLLVPTVFYLWLQRYVQKQLESRGGDAIRSAAYDRRSDLKQSRRLLRLIVNRRLG